MNQNEHIKLKTDANYIHIKHAVVEVTIGSTLANSYAWIKCISHGFDTAENLLAFKLTSDGYEPILGSNGQAVRQEEYLLPNKDGIAGNVGEYQVVSLADVEPYNRGGKIDFTPNISIG